MRKLLLIAGVTIAVAAPMFAVESADAATRCERSRSTTRAVGTVAGGVLGALAGSAIDGGRNNTAGIIIGGTAGAVAGNQIAKGKPCPAGYVQRSYYEPRYSSRSAPARSASTRVASSRCAWEYQNYRDAYGNVVRRQVQVCR